MKQKKEKNITVYNQDVDEHGRYVYTDKNNYSQITARNRQAEEVMKVLNGNFKRNISILEAGCGDGTFAFELMTNFKPKYLLGFDAAKKAIANAKKKIPPEYRNKLTFKNINIYDVKSKIRKNDFDVILIWGVLHHLYEPKKAIKAIANLTDHIIVHEANGYNPVLKIIEKISPYHRKHEEKSYFPNFLNEQFRMEGYTVKKEVYHGIVPYFCNKDLAVLLKRIEPIVEKTPLLNKLLCGSVLLYYTKSK